ncbi:hypothetical protein GCM10009789_31390 [Kribbella sancticallisti]|uniref:Uncharacterized protein n=1 Tax=Kribbella sancticallisti TaxID=460087 RepID=A0ABN2DH56_9ACTN
MGDDDDAAAGERAGVRDGAGGGGEDLLAGGAGQVDAAVAGEPRFGGKVEAADDLGAWVQRPDGVGGFGDGGRAGL